MGQFGPLDGFIKYQRCPAKIGYYHPGLVSKHEICTPQNLVKRSLQMDQVGLTQEKARYLANEILTRLHGRPFCAKTKM